MSASRVSRRDLLKAGSALAGAAALARLAPGLAPSRSGAASERPRILIFVFDAMSAENLSVYGYRRRTTPNLERFAQRATVYHQHYSTANFTTPGTASLVTGLYPWTHRAINQSGVLARAAIHHNIFRALGPQYHRLAFSQNLWPTYFFGQFADDLDEILSPASFSLVDQIVGDRLPRDLDNTHRVYDEFMFEDGRPPISLVFGLYERIMLRRATARAASQDYPRGLPRTGYYPVFYTLEQVFKGMRSTVERLPEASIAYLHDWAPHAPYRPSRQFDDLFADRWGPKPKPEHALGDHALPKQMDGHRQNYDEYVANLDYELGRLLDGLQASGVLEHSYVVLTSDHGEMFERGVEGHNAPLLYEPVVHIPLLISSPGQSARQDVYAPTSSVDVLPTLVHLAGGQRPAWCEGELLPGLGGAEQPRRSLFMMNSMYNSAFQPLTVGTFGLREGEYKLTCYRGYSQYDKRDVFELYDLSDDPAELNDLYSDSSPVAQDLRVELLGRLHAENAKSGKAG